MMVFEDHRVFLAGSDVTVLRGDFTFCRGRCPYCGEPIDEESGLLFSHLKNCPAEPIICEL